MGQAEIIDYLEKQTEPKGRKEIAEALGLQITAVSHNLRKLLDRDEVKCIELDRFQAGKLLGMNKPFRRTRFYYVDSSCS